MKCTLDENNLSDKPGQIFNIVETGLPLDPKPLRTIHKLGAQNPFLTTSGDKSQITIVGCVSAAGYCLPPMVIYDRKRLSPEMSRGEVLGTLYGLSEKGWIDMELFSNWFHSHFLRYAPTARPLLLLMDGHSSHYCPDTIRMAAQEKIIIFALPPNTTHITQPLDKGCFGPLKLAWRKVCHQYMTSNPGKVVNRFCFSELFAEAWMKSMTLTNITAGFRVTGVYPVNRNAFVLPEEECHNHIDSSLAASNGLKYIPLYSPACQHTQSCTTPIVEADSDSEMFSRESSPEVDQSQDPESTQFTVEEIKNLRKDTRMGMTYVVILVIICG